MLVKVYSCSIQGLTGITITVEVSVTEGMKYYMVGLPDSAVKESWQRVESAIKMSGYHMPRRRIVINLAPADVRKEGSAYDLPIAIGILWASQQIAPAVNLDKVLLLGELALDGVLRPVKGILPATIHAKEHGFEKIIIPEANAVEAGVVKGVEVIGVKTLKQAIGVIEGSLSYEPVEVDPESVIKDAENTGYQIDISDVKGQLLAKRALLISAAGGHNLLMVGPPGAGKSMLAQRIVTILPPLTLDEALETTKIYSVAGLLPPRTPLIVTRPFRAPHHTISDVALVGGGVNPQPGEISLAHNGVLFLDELPEFKRHVLEVLRQPLETRKIVISRANYTVEFPANFTLICAMNPCPCGYYNHPARECTCTPGMIRRYASRISGPLFDRIDMHIQVAPTTFAELHSNDESLTSKEVREQVIKVRQLQKERYAGMGINLNAQLTPKLIRQFCPLSQGATKLLEQAMEKYQFSARAHNNIIKVARTIADLEGSEVIQTSHMAEAIQYRILDRSVWGN